jgi:hypothetical protein
LPSILPLRKKVVTRHASHRLRKPPAWDHGLDGMKFRILIKVSFKMILIKSLKYRREIQNIEIFVHGQLE